LRSAVADLRIIRPGLLTGDTATGATAPTCTLTAFFRAIATLGCIAEGDHERLRVDVTPVDVAARAIAVLVTSSHAHPVVHVASERGASLADLLRAVRAHRPVEVVDHAELLRRARASLTRSEALAFAAASHRVVGIDGHRDADLFLHTDRLFPCALVAHLTGCPPRD